MIAIRNTTSFTIAAWASITVTRVPLPEMPAELKQIVEGDRDKHEEFIGPDFFVYSAALEMHPLDTDDRIADMKHKANIGLLQHHRVLHARVPGAHPHHRQRHYSAEKSAATTR